jgi:uncharacterized protein involved in oxidation of intracellular sulfur
VKIVFVLNDAPYGSERSYNGLRTAGKLLLSESRPDVSVFLIGDGVACAKKGQKTPDGYYNVERMLKPLVRAGEIVLCGSCMDARGLGEDEVLDGCRRGSLQDLESLVLEADKVLVF